MTLFSKDLETGGIGADVFRLQDILEKLGYEDFIPTGFYGPKTFQAVRLFQIKNGITPIGRFGPKTREKLNSMIATNSEFLYWVAKSFLGRDASPLDIADDDVGCVESVNAVYEKAFGNPIGEKFSTRLLYLALKDSPLFESIPEPARGSIIISPTNMGNGKLKNGHVGICGDKGDKGDKIMSSNSSNGFWEENYTQESWRARYSVLGGFPILFYRRV